MTAWICDVNGVLVDSTAIARDAFAATAGHWRFSFTEHDFSRVKGFWLLEAYRILDPGGEPFTRRRFHLQYVRDRIRDVHAYPHVAEMLAAARARGIRVGAATSHGETAEACLVNNGLYSYIDCLVTQEEVKRPKPHPESILRVLALSFAKITPARSATPCSGDRVTAASVRHRRSPHPSTRPASCRTRAVNGITRGRTPRNPARLNVRRRVVRIDGAVHQLPRIRTP